MSHGRFGNKMRITIVSAIFPPEPVVSARTSAQLAEALATADHEVRVVTGFPSRPAGQLYPGWRRRLFSWDRTETHYALLRCFSFTSPVSSLASRALENFSFGLTSAAAVLCGRRPDVLYLNTWPLLATGLMALIARLRRIPYVLSVQDVYPESIESQGRIRPEGTLARLMRAVDGRTANRARAIVVIADQFARIYVEDRKVPAEKVRVIPNWTPTDSVTPDVSRDEFRRRYGIAPEAFVFGYGGNIGAAAGVPALIATFQEARLEADTHLLIAGGGSQVKVCQRLAAAGSGDSVVIHSPWLSTETSAVLAAADVLVLPTQGEQTLASVPSKLLSYMLAARPVIAQAVTGSETARVIEAAGCGWVIEPGDEARLRECLSAVRCTPTKELAERGRAGRRYVLKNLSQDQLLPRLMEVVTGAAGRDRK